MKLKLNHFSIRAPGAFDSWVKDQLQTLQQVLRIDEAVVRLAHLPERSPAFVVKVHLVTPGPDVIAEERDHTLRAAFAKVMARLRRKIGERGSKRLQRLHSSDGVNETPRRGRSWANVGKRLSSNKA